MSSNSAREKQANRARACPDAREPSINIKQSFYKNLAPLDYKQAEHDEHPD